MNKKNVVTSKNIANVATFIENSVGWLVNNQAGCCRFNLNKDLAIFVGWLDGYDIDDDDIVKEASPNRDNGCCYAVVCGIRIRNDYDDCDLEWLNAPIYNDDSGEVYDVSSTLAPNMKRRDYRKEARYMLEQFVDMKNLLDKGELTIEF